MAQDFFRIYRGLELDDSAKFLTGSGDPGLTADTNGAQVGSYYTNTSNGDLWSKISVGSGTDKWRLQATQEYVQNFLTSGISWREPAVVHDNVLTTLPTGTPGSPIVVDSISISDGERVLFSAISGAGGPNVYIYDQTNGIFVEDTNIETDGDTVFIQEGTRADQTWQFDGTVWFLITTSTSGAELGHIRNFIGKDTAGATFPVYTSNNYITDGDDLEAAIGDLDAALAQANLQTTVTNVTTLTIIDSVVAETAEWDIYVVDVGSPTRTWAGKVFAMHNGIASDHTQFAVLRLNGMITGLIVSVSLTGGNTLNLEVTSSAPVDVKAQRLAAIV